MICATRPSTFAGAGILGITWWLRPGTAASSAGPNAPRRGHERLVIVGVDGGI
jgi:hypothetical protein